MGVYESLPHYMSAFRKKIDANTAEFERLIKQYDNNDEFRIVGDMYKKKFAHDKSDAVMNYYQRKNLAFMMDRPIDELITKRELLDFCLEKLLFLMPMTDYMSSIHVEE